MEPVAYKLVILLRSRGDLAPDAFAREWVRAEADDPVSAPGLVSYVFDAPLEGPSPIAGAPAGPFDAAIETWWERKNDAANWVVTREFQDGWLARRRPLLDAHPSAVGGAPRVIWDREASADADPVKLLILPVALRRLRFPEFVDHWTGDHARLALEGPGATERLLRLEDTPAAGDPPSRFSRGRYDGVGAVTFVSAAAAAAEFSSDHYRERLAPDERRFTDPTVSTAFLTTPTRYR